MTTEPPKYLVGIDLGTTHTVVAYTQADRTATSDIHLFTVEQLIAPGEVAARPLLPSVRYHPAEGELSAEDLKFSFMSGPPAIMGEAARLLGSKSSGRLVTSAKSWLSHPSIDPVAQILPWGSHDDVAKVSPLDASASYLAHVRNVWRYRFPDAPLEQQNVVITVPASFDEGARSLTLEAAKMAGLNDIKLLEEPQAVCYDWLRRHGSDLRQILADVHLLLICDVGGGTTDLTLIKIEQTGQEPKLTRIGVGDHLMLGGDNIDLALAHLAESRINPNGGKMSAADFSQLIEQCRIAKERLLADDAPEQCAVTLLGGGSKLIGGTRSAPLSRQEVQQIALDGFLPLTGLNELPDKKRSGVVEFGLPYAAEPAISKHIAAFLKLHQQAGTEALGQTGYVPDAVLLNGGLFRSQPITQRTLNLLASWQQKPPVLLDNPHPELAVAYGAVSYALARQEKKLKIGGGAARSYFLVVDTDQNTHRQGVCILPKGSEEGEEVILQDRQFALRIGQPVRFHLESSPGDSDYQAGELIALNDDDFHSLPPMAVVFQGEDKQEVQVRLSVMQTEIGTLKIQCVAVADPNQRYDVEFQIRHRGMVSTVTAELPDTINQAVARIQDVFGLRSKKMDPKAVKGLRAELEKILGLSRDQWETPVLRALFDTLLANVKNRRRSENHERVWLSLVGFCLRPGFGYPLDDWRVEQIWKGYQSGIQFVNERQNWTEWWTLWRRVAGGLNVDQQEKIFADIAKFLNPAAARQPGVAKQIKIRGYDDMVRVVGVLERLSVKQKIQCVEWLLKRLEKPSESNQTWWAVGRLAARVPFYGGSHTAIPADQVALWLPQILALDWKKNPQAAFAATIMARMSGDRARDLQATERESVIEKLRNSKSPTSWVAMVESYQELNEAEEKQIFGEALPPGLKLIH